MSSDGPAVPFGPIYRVKPITEPGQLDLEMREMAVFELTVAKEGLKMNRAEPPVVLAAEASANAPVPRPGTFFGPGIIESPAIRMSQLVKTCFHVKNANSNRPRGSPRLQTR